MPREKILFPCFVVCGVGKPQACVLISSFWVFWFPSFFFLIFYPFSYGCHYVNKVCSPTKQVLFVWARFLVTCKFILLLLFTEKTKEKKKKIVLGLGAFSLSRKPTSSGSRNWSCHRHDLIVMGMTSCSIQAHKEIVTTRPAYCWILQPNLSQANLDQACLGLVKISNKILFALLQYKSTFDDNHRWFWENLFSYLHILDARYLVPYLQNCTGC